MDQVEKEYLERFINFIKILSPKEQVNLIVFIENESKNIKRKNKY